MPAKTHQFWLSRIYEQCVNYPKRTANEVADVLMRVRNEEIPIGVPPPPFTRTVSDRMALFKKEFSEEQKQQYGYADWPDSCISGALPNEASAALLRLLRYYAEVGETRKPTVTYARWFWRLWTAADDAAAPVKRIADLAVLLAEREDDPENAMWAWVKWHVAFKLWTSDGRDAYRKAHAEHPDALPPYDQGVSGFLKENPEDGALKTRETRGAR